MATNEFGEIDILEEMRNAVVHGIDSHGKIVASGATPDYGGSSSGEDFYVYKSSSQISINIFSPFLYYDDTHDVSVPQKPFIEIGYEPQTATRQTFGREVRAGIVFWSVIVGENDGYLEIDGITYKNERACMVLRDRLYRIAERLSFDEVILLQRTDAEPSSVYPIEGDDRTYRADVSLYIEYWPEII